MNLNKSKILLSLSLLVVVTLTCAGGLMRVYNADDLYPYSEALDLITYGTLKGWAFAAVPFTFPDAMLSIPMVAVVQNPFVFHVLSAPFELLCFTLLYALLRASRDCPFTQTFAALSVASAACAVLGLLILRTPFYFLVEPFFILAHHGAAAWAAVLLLATKQRGLAFRDKATTALFAIAVVALTASDFFFAFYFCFLLLFAFKNESFKQNAVVLALVFMQALAVFVISWKVNPSLSIQAYHSGPHANGALSARFRFFLHTLLLSAPVIALYIWCRWKRISGVDAFPCAFGAVAASTVAAIAGLISDDFTYRYATILFPAAVILATESILHYWSHRLVTLVSASLIFLLIAIVVIGRREGVESRDVYDSEIQCLRLVAIPGSMIVAGYWPAKVVFESTGRRFNLRQVNANGDPYYWIYNRRWEALHPENGIEYLILDGLSPNGILNVVAGRTHSTVCDGKILQIGTSTEMQK